MRAPRFRRPSPAMVVALVALTLALGGASYAATALPRKSVGAKQLRRGAVTRTKLRRGAVTSTAVRDHSLRGRDFKAGQIPIGPQGPKGDRGTQGEPGTPGQDGAPGTPASQEWGWIRSNGSIGAQQGVTKVEHTAATGVYDVSFDRPVSQTCAPVVTPNTAAAFKATWTFGVDPAIRVNTFNAADVATDVNFSIVLACPPSGP